MNVIEHTSIFGRIRFFLVFLALGGCAVCQEHRVACTIAGGVVATSIIISASRDNQHFAPDAARRTIGAPTCNGGTCQ
jgi:hypothetical protein